MPQRTALEDIDLLPYHALQAEAGKYSLRRNLGAAKLRQALKQILGNNSSLSNLPAEWFIASANPELANSQAARAAHPGRAPKPKTKPAPNVTVRRHPVRIARAAVRRSPIMTRARRAKNPPKLKSSSPSTSNVLSADRHAHSKPPPLPSHSDHTSPEIKQSPSTHSNVWVAEPDLLNDRHTSGTVLPPLPSYSEGSSPRSRVAPGHMGETSENLDSRSLPPESRATHADQGPYFSPEDFRRAIRDEGTRLRLTRSTNEQNISFLAELVHHTLEQINRGKHVSCSLRVSYEPIEFDLPRVSPHANMTIYQNQVMAASPQSQVVPWSAVQTESSARRTPLSSPPRAVFPDRLADVHAPPEAGEGPPSSARRTPLSSPPPRAVFPGHLADGHAPLDAGEVPRSAARRTPLSPPAARAVFSDHFADVHTPPEAHEGPYPTAIRAILSPDESFFAVTDRGSPVHRKREARSWGSNENPASSSPRKKAKLGSPTNQQIEVRQPNLQGVHGAVASSSVAPPPPAPFQMPSGGLKFFPSPKPSLGSRMLAGRRPSPDSSPDGPPARSTLFGTEHHYGDRSPARFRDFDPKQMCQLLPSPINRNRKK